MPSTPASRTTLRSPTPDTESPYGCNPSITTSSLSPIPATDPGIDCGRSVTSLVISRSAGIGLCTIEVVATRSVDSDVTSRSATPLTLASVVRSELSVVILRVPSPTTDSPDTSNPNPSIVTLRSPIADTEVPTVISEPSPVISLSPIPSILLLVTRSVNSDVISRSLIPDTDADVMRSVYSDTISRSAKPSDELSVVRSVNLSVISRSAIPATNPGTDCGRSVNSDVISRSTGMGLCTIDVVATTSVDSEVIVRSPVAATTASVIILVNSDVIVLVPSPTTESPDIRSPAPLT